MCIRDRFPELRIVLKSGNFGQKDFFFRALDITGTPESANRREEM